jgi:GNAT superfamily N-acetyltransferase
LSFFDASYREDWPLDGGGLLLLRLIQPGDKALVAAGFKRLSPQSRYRRFFLNKHALTESELCYLTDCDGMNHFALVAILEQPMGITREGIGVARFVRLSDDPLSAEVGLTVIDAFQHRGIGRLLLGRLFLAAAERGLRRLEFHVRAENAAMLCALRRVAPAAVASRSREFDFGVVTLVAPIPQPRAARESLSPASPL